MGADSGYVALGRDSLIMIAVCECGGGPGIGGDGEADQSEEGQKG